MPSIKSLFLELTGYVSVSCRFYFKNQHLYPLKYVINYTLFKKLRVPAGQKKKN